MASTSPKSAAHPAGQLNFGGSKRITGSASNVSKHHHPHHQGQQQQQQAANSSNNIFGYTPPPEEPNLLPRDVWRFLQRLDLSTPIKNPRREFSNGYLAAEMMARFYPVDVDPNMHSYQNGTSEPVKRDNWEQVCRVAQKHELQLPGHLVDGTIKGAPGAAVSLLESMYEQLTGKKVQRLDPKQQATGLDAAAGLSAAAAAAAALAADEPPVSFGEPVAAADSGALRAIRAAGTAAPTLEFGAVQTQHAGSAADIRKKFAGSSI